MIYWFPIIWNDYDFDHNYLTIIIKHKLKAMEAFERSDNAWAMRAPEIADQIKTVRLLLERIEKDEYHEMVFRHHDKKWGELDMWTTPCDRKDLVECSITRTKICDRDSYDQENKESKRLYKHVEYMKQQDINYAFELMARNYQGWWD
jgi:hypothetical protein